MTLEKLDIVREEHSKLTKLVDDERSINSGRLFTAFAIGLLGIVHLPGIRYTEAGIGADQSNMISVMYNSREAGVSTRIAKATSRLNSLIGSNTILCTNEFNGDQVASKTITDYALKTLKDATQPDYEKVARLMNMYPMLDPLVLPTKLNGQPSDFIDIFKYMVSNDLTKQFAWLTSHRSKTNGLFEARFQKLLHLTGLFYGDPKLSAL